MAVSSLLLLILTLSTSPFLTSSSKTHPSDVHALMLLKLSVDPTSVLPSSCLSSWDFSVDPCASAFTERFTCGLRCDAADSSGYSRVTDLSLDQAGYSGPLSSSVWSLPFLQTLSLADNRFSGPIPSPPPPALPSALRSVTLSRNSFSGEIPVFPPAPSLQELSLDGNLLSGTIAGKFDELVALQRLELQRNNITGALPDRLGLLASLSYLDASDNALSGGLPAADLPPSLVQISLRNNGLAGALPGGSALAAALPALQVLDLSRNRVSGAVPASLFRHPALEQLSLGYNRLEAIEEPADRGAGSRLVAVDLKNNELAGLLPAFLGAMPRLSAVDLESNRFTGMIPADYAVRAVGGGAEAVPFGRLLLAGNYLFGPIPSPMETMEEGSAMVSLADNCLFRCPATFFFCRGLEQKSPSTCRDFNPVIP
ncbi:receptor-like protein kinase precursor [Iris pallida]|uniref:Receptor-like protein kinase n=1 Tax=Iris pallida TaxID=29817 RepID=A0AAX6DTP0_IRIPA|nr:receptor-like protein kinase precursor [Iris pallida]